MLCAPHRYVEFIRHQGRQPLQARGCLINMNPSGGICYTNIPPGLPYPCGVNKGEWNEP